ncbi:PA2779 family protein [Wenzhouxiangella sp. AB-CW3]|uniref:PA2779 family protein n=1 Tax=Wenzhouxiangella sp. AB-CW3 TaxID=2771012 RepID=UPI00168B707B|nr:PA2779 family protein [Wenzhouxiangella sp. AB-CW3]QOC22661.1 PA2779 family protein [Wenzhouxiangella sp. AB-CW3]
MNRKLAKLALAALLGTALLPLLSFSAHAEIISTQEAAAIESGQSLASVEAWLARDDVQSELASLGVDPELARLRAEALSPEELEELAGRIDELPAGAGAIEVLGITFLVLIVLELVGVINIFNR